MYSVQERVNDYLKVAELNVIAEPGVPQSLPSDSHSTFVTWSKRLIWTQSIINVTNELVRCRVILLGQHLHSETTASPTLSRLKVSPAFISFGSRQRDHRKGTAWPRLASHSYATLTKLRNGCIRTITTLPLTLTNMWRYPPGAWSTWHVQPTPAAPGSAFICDHSNVNSLSLLISILEIYSWRRRLYMQSVSKRQMKMKTY